MTRKIEVFSTSMNYHRYIKAISTVNALIRLIKGKQLMLGRENLNRLQYSIDFMKSSNASSKKKEEIAGKSIVASLDRNIEYLGVIQLSNVLDETFKKRNKEFAFQLIQDFINFKSSEVHEVDRNNLIYILKEIRDDLEMNQRLNK
ncbi:MAG: hypothetical protein KBD26_02300 [Candidatus Pacebacteria bacterium]|nr:hypothetical protein [Candidatus Paceibacterota bacterium]MBP9772644.1 hypothetical protein [Candidatus Paceibacterota bacterium]